jgi:hypothetical protein
MVEYEKLYGRRVWRRYLRNLISDLGDKAKQFFFNYQPFGPGILPYEAQRRLQKKFRGYRPKWASLVSAIGLGVMGLAVYTYLAYIPKDLFRLGYYVTRFEYDPYFGFIEYRQFITTFKIPKLPIQALAAYLAAESVPRALLTLFKRPVGTLIAEGPLYLIRRVIPSTEMYKRAKAEVEKELAEQRRREAAYARLSHTDEVCEQVRELSWRLWLARRSRRRELTKLLRQKMNRLIKKELRLKPARQV